MSKEEAKERYMKQIKMFPLFGATLFKAVVSNTTYVLRLHWRICS
jgi:hypothetical protein